MVLLGSLFSLNSIERGIVWIDLDQGKGLVESMNLEPLYVETGKGRKVPVFT